MNYKNFSKYDNMHLANLNSPTVDRLAPGCYQFRYNSDSDQRIFEGVEFKHDTLIDLPSKEYNQIIDQINHFLTPETKKAFNDFGFLYKRSILMHGKPGTGKTCLANRIANKVVSEGGIVLFNPEPNYLSYAFEVLNSIQPETTVVVIFEELDALVTKYEESLLNILDGEIQRENVIYLATTNYIEDVPARIMRPGRFSNVVEIRHPTQKAREFYLSVKTSKVLTKDQIKDWAKKTKGYSIDELKESVLSVHCLNIPFDEVNNRIKESRNLQDKKAARDVLRNSYNSYADYYEIQNQIQQQMKDISKMELIP